MKLLRRLTVATTLATVLVIAVGGFVRSSGSGDGCPDWPKCFGRWFPPLEFSAIVEYTHRYAGAIAISLLLATTALVFAKHRSDRRLLWPAVIASVMILMQAGLGGIVVAVKDRAKVDPSVARFEGSLVTFHIATAMILIGMLVVMSIRTHRLFAQPSHSAVSVGLRRFTIWTAAGVYGLILVGAYMRGSHASLAFKDWPLMDGTLLPDLTGLRGIHFAHRAAALIVGLMIVSLLIRVRRELGTDHVLFRAVAVSGVLFVTQSVVGGLQIFTALDSVPVAAHVLLSALVWSCLVGAVVTCRPLAMAEKRAARARTGAGPQPAPISGAQVDVVPAQRTRGASVAAYVALTKPRIISLLLVTTIPAMVLASRGVPSWWLIFATMFGGTLAAGAANAINMVIDRDIDAIMSRTRSRPLPAHSITPTRALVFAMSLAATSFVFMVATVNLLAAVLAQSALVFYVFVYTLALKRSTPQNIVIGGAAGAVPALVGWAAVSGTVSLEAWLLFSIIFSWTPPHFWALAVRYSRDYEAAGIPMLPVVAGREKTQRAIVGYTVVTLLLSLGLWAVAGLGWIYGAAAILLGAWFLRDARRLGTEVSAAKAMTVFKTSIYYLGLLFAAVAVDVLILGSGGIT